MRIGRTHALMVVAEGVPPPAGDAGKTLRPA